MTYSVLFKSRRSIASRLSSVTVLDHRPSHHALKAARLPPTTGNDLFFQQLQAVAPSALAVRRVRAGAGATPVFVAVIRHDTSFARVVSLMGRSRTCPFSFNANHAAIRKSVSRIFKESSHGNRHPKTA